MTDPTPDLAAIREGYAAHRYCGVCRGVSPGWDGHDVNPACWGHVIESIPALLAEVERLSAALADAAVALDDVRSIHPPKTVDRKLAALRHALAAAVPSGEQQ